MGICPECKKEFRTRKGGACPHCMTPIESYNGVFFRGSIGSPTVGVLHVFERDVSEQLSAARGMHIVFTISSKTPQYRRELVSAEGLLAMCDYDYDWVVETINTLFTDKKFSFKQRNSLIGLTKDFNVARAISKSVLDARRKKRALEEKTINDVMNKEDVFA